MRLVQYYSDKSNKLTCPILQPAPISPITWDVDTCFQCNVLADTATCYSNPCMNGGVCADGDDLFTCTCAAGFIGATCDVGKIFFLNSLTNFFRILMCA